MNVTIRALRLALLALSITWLCGCLSEGQFPCASDSQCTKSGAAGICVQGYCAFTDEACGGTSLRWDDTAAPELAGQCVSSPDHGGADLAMTGGHPDMAVGCNHHHLPCGMCVDDSDCPITAHAATAGCSFGSCKIKTCDVGYGDCNLSYGDGCEAMFRTDVNHCGACGVACSSPTEASGTACVAASCTITGCTAGHADCDNLFGNGCEVNLAASDADCGACGTTCPVNRTCTGGNCVPFSDGASCGGLPATCGHDGNRSCCENTLVTGGAYFRGYDVAGDANSGDMSYPATVSDFRLDRYEITIGRFRKFLADVGGGWRPTDGMGANPYLPASGWNYDKTNWPFDAANLETNIQCGQWTHDPGGNELLPMICIDWYEAFVFCAWDGGFLPTEAEWNYAAAGGREQRAYPWSDPPGDLTIDCSYADFQSGNGPPCDLTTPNVGTESPKGDGRWGQSDLAGSVAELVLDWSDGYPVPCVDCAALSGVGQQRVYRGGESVGMAPDLRSGSRSSLDPTMRYNFVGARCARSK